MVSGRYFLDVCEATCRKRTPLDAVISVKLPGASDTDDAAAAKPANAKAARQMHALKTPLPNSRGSVCGSKHASIFSSRAREQAAVRLFPQARVIFTWAPR